MNDDLNRIGTTTRRTPETDLAGVVFEIQRTQTNSCKFGRKHKRLFSRQELRYLGIAESIYREIVVP